MSKSARYLIAGMLTLSCAMPFIIVGIPYLMQMRTGAHLSVLRHLSFQDSLQAAAMPFLAGLPLLFGAMAACFVVARGIGYATGKCGRLVRKSRQFRRDEKAMAAVEFALIGPVAIFMLFGAISAFLSYRAEMKLATTAETLAELVAQGTSITPDQISDLCSAGKLIMTPDNSTGTTAGSHMLLSVTSVAYESAASPAWFIPGNGKALNLGWNSNPALSVSSGATNCTGILNGAQTDTAMFTEGGNYGAGGDPSTNATISGAGGGTAIINTDGAQVIVGRAVYVFNNPFGIITNTSLLNLPGGQLFATTSTMIQYGYALAAKGSVLCNNC